MIPLLIRLRLLCARNAARQLVARGRFRLITVVLTLSVFWAVLFWGFYRAFAFLQGFLGLGEILIDRLLFLLAFALFGLLAVSNAVISFQLHYKSRETAFLMTLPLPGPALFAYLGLETVALSTWASAFLILPVALAYGLTHALPAWAYLGFLLFGFGLAALAALVGMLVSAAFPRLLASPVLRVAALTVLAAVLLYPAGRRLNRPERPSDGDQRVFMVNDLLQHSRLTLHPLVPSYWATEGFLQFVRGRPGRAVLFLAVIAANLFFLASLAHLRGGIPYRRAWALYQGRGRKKRRAIASAGRPRRNLLGFLSPPVRAFLVKDARVFLRDPAQWIQALVLFGLLAVYIVNIRRMPAGVHSPFWKNLIAFFNLSATALILATTTTRFVFPALSLEGKTFWIVGLAPARRSLVLWSKFWTSFLAALLITEGLMALSNHILEIPPGAQGLTAGAVFLMSLTLVSLALGMGAAFPDFRNDSPARIASGFGGTLSLIASLAYVAAMVGIVVLAVQASASRREALAAFRPWAIPGGIAAASLLSAAVSAFSLRLGLRSLDRREF